MEKVLPPPDGWMDDSLTGFFERAHRNRFATFANKKNCAQRLIALDACFVSVAKDWQNPPNLLIPFFFFRCHSAFRAACEHAMSGQVTEAFPQIRTCLEYAGYALYIHKNSGLAETWLKRHDDDDTLKAVKKEFTVANVRSSIKNVNSRLEQIFGELYQRAIDFGGHPNERAITGSMNMINLGDQKSYESIYLHGDGLAIDHALKSTAQAGVCSLEVLQAVYPERNFGDRIRNS